MRSLISMIAPCAALLAVCAAGPVAAQVTVIHAGSVIADANSEPTGPATVTISEGRIVSIMEGHQTPTGMVRVIELTDKTVLPGLIDLHVHLTGDPGGDYRQGTVDTDEYGTLVGAKNARVTALAGFTTVREAGSGESDAFARRSMDRT